MDETGGQRTRQADGTGRDGRIEGATDGWTEDATDARNGRTCWSDGTDGQSTGRMTRGDDGQTGLDLSFNYLLFSN